MKKASLFSIVSLGADFVCETDLWVACTILDKQIEHINGNKENIIIPGEAMEKIRQRQETDREKRCSIRIHHDISSLMNLGTSVDEMKEPSCSTGSSSDSSDSNMVTSGSSVSPNVAQEEQSKGQMKTTEAQVVVNPCALCLSEEKSLACLPCGHLATCVPCGHSLRSCPICRHAIEGFVRVYL